MHPQARRERIITKLLDDELILYDQDQDQAHRLNRIAAAVWTHSDGQRSVASLARLLGEETGHVVDEDTVHLAVAQLSEAGVMSDPVALPSLVSRRVALRRAAAIAGVALVPTVITIVAPRPADAQSAGESGGGTGDGEQRQAQLEAPSEEQLDASEEEKKKKKAKKEKQKGRKE
jgi:hypothetical protein